MPAVAQADEPWLLGASVLARGVQNGEFETCPVWVLGMDMGWRFGPIVLKTMRVPRFDHGAIWVAKVRNVSRVGSQQLRAISAQFNTTTLAISLAGAFETVGFRSSATGFFVSSVST